MEILDAGFVDSDTLAILVRYDGASEPHRFNLFLPEPWGATRYAIQGALLQHEAPANHGTDDRGCRLDFDFREQVAVEWMLFSDRRAAMIPVARRSVRRRREPAAPTF